MADLTIENASICSTCVSWRKVVKGSKNVEYVFEVACGEKVGASPADDFERALVDDFRRKARERERHLESLLYTEGHARSDRAVFHFDRGKFKFASKFRVWAVDQDDDVANMTIYNEIDHMFRMRVTRVQVLP